MLESPVHPNQILLPRGLFCLFYPNRMAWVIVWFRSVDLGATPECVSVCVVDRLSISANHNLCVLLDDRMATADINQLESLPWELLEKIIELLPTPDILGLKQVRNDTLSDVHTISSPLKINRGFRDLIRSPRIPHRLHSYAARLERNLAAGVTVADSIKALEEYHSKQGKFTSEEEQMTVRIPVREFERDETAGGVYGLATKHDILFFTLPLNSRTIQSRGQTVSLDFRVTGFAFYPQADVVVVAGQTGYTV